MRLSWAGLAVSFLCAGCAALRPTPSPSTDGRQGDGKTAMGSVDPATEDLEALRPGLRSKADTLLLNLLLGYHRLALQPGADTLGKARQKAAREAYTQLEHWLRHGGLESRDRGERVFTVQPGDRLSLGELIAHLDQLTLKAAASGDWDGAAERSRELLAQRRALSRLLEDASWVLVLASAMQGPEPESVRRSLWRLHESYTLQVDHAELVHQVQALLKEVRDPTLKKELKKLANRSWDRQKEKEGRPPTVEPLKEEKPEPAEIAAPVDATPPDGSASLPDWDAGSNGGEALSDSGVSALKQQVDTLVLQGRYLDAAAALNRLEGQASSEWVKERRETAGSRFCEEKRKTAAKSFAQSRRAGDAPTRDALLRRTLVELDSCLFHFPDASVAPKVRRNRDIVEKDLKQP